MILNSTLSCFSTIIWHEILFASYFILLGILHFSKPDFYFRIMPDYIPYPKFVTYLIGVIVFIAGVMLIFPQTKSYGVTLVIAYLIVVTPTYLKMLWDTRLTFGTSKTILWLSLFLIFLLIFWAYKYFD